MFYLNVILMLLCGAATGDYLQNKECITIKEKPNSCIYFIMTNELSHDDAVQYCYDKLNGALAHFQSYDEVKAIIQRYFWWADNDEWGISRLRFGMFKTDNYSTSPTVFSPADTFPKALDMDIWTCEYADILYFRDPLSRMSNLFVFIPMDIERTGSNFKGMKVYGTKITKALNEPMNIEKEFEIINYTYALPSKCGFDPNNFKVGIDMNVIFMLVKCENHLSFLRSQVNFERSIVFTPKTWLVHFYRWPTKDDSNCKNDNKIAFLPLNVDEAKYGHGDSYVIRYCNTLTSDNSLTFFATELHNINGHGNKLSTTTTPIKYLTATKIENIFFMDSRSFILKLDSKSFYMGLIDEEYIKQPKDIFLRQDTDSKLFNLVFKNPLVAIGRVSENFYPASIDGRNIEWKFRAKQDPILQDKMDAAVACGYSQKYKTFSLCIDDLEGIKTILYILYGLGGLELLLILSTLIIFAVCICKQRKRRRLHRQRKARKEEKKKNLIKNGPAPDGDSKNATNDGKSEYLIVGMTKDKNAKDAETKKPKSEYISPGIKSRKSVDAAAAAAKEESEHPLAESKYFVSKM